jgi:hypothetical protein
VAFNASISDRPARASDRTSDGVALASTVAAAQYQPDAYRSTMALETTRISSDRSIQSQLVMTYKDDTGGGASGMSVTDVRGGGGGRVASEDRCVQVTAGMEPGVDSMRRIGTGGEDPSITTSERRVDPTTVASPEVGGRPFDVAQQDNTGARANPHLSFSLDLKFDEA